MINNDDNSACRFAEDLVSYLYGEIGEAEKTRFETHLAQCRGCAAEFKDFGVIRAAVSQWRERDFAPLETPSIEIPATEFPPKAVATASTAGSWPASLRQLFTFSSAWTGAATAAAALLIGAGLFYIAASSLRSTGTKDVSEVNKNVSVKSAVPTPTVQTSGTAPVAEPDKQTGGSTPPPVAATSPSTGQTNRKSTTPVSGRSTEPVKTAGQPKTSKKPAGTAPRATKRSDVHLIADEDEEDETLRLSDLFDEIGGD